MNNRQKYKSGTITITDLEPGINTAGKARGAGFVMFNLRTVTEQIHTIEVMWGDMEHALKAFPGTKNYVRHLYRTRTRINEHFEPEPRPQPQT